MAIQSISKRGATTVGPVDEAQMQKGLMRGELIPHARATQLQYCPDSRAFEVWFGPALGIVLPLAGYAEFDGLTDEVLASAQLTCVGGAISIEACDLDVSIEGLLSANVPLHRLCTSVGFRRSNDLDRSMGALRKVKKIGLDPTVLQSRAQLQKALAVTANAFDQLKKAGRLFEIDKEGQGRGYPAFLAWAPLQSAAMREVLDLFHTTAEMSPVDAYLFLTSITDLLAYLTPLEVLWGAVFDFRQGEISVIAAKTLALPQAERDRLVMGCAQTYVTVAVSS